MRTFFRYILEEQDIRTLDDFLPPYRKAAAQLGAENVDPSRSTFEAWFYNGRRPQKTFRRVIVEMLGYSIADLWTEVPAGTVPDFRPLSSTSPTAPHANLGMDLDHMKRTGAMAVQRAKQFLLGADRDRVGDDTLGLLNDDLVRLVGAYPREPLSEIWTDLLETQEQVFRTLESGRVRPSQLRELHFNAGVLAFLVAKGFNDMEQRDHASTMARVAASHARDAEHDGLSALVEGLKSLIAFWADKPTDALHYARQGGHIAANLKGTVGLWLLGLEARAAAVLGDEGTVRSANQLSTERRDRVVLDDLDELGGLLTYSREKQLYYSVEAEALLGHGGAHLAAQAEDAVRAFSDPEAPFWAFGDLAGTQCDLALVRLHSEDVEGAAAALRPVLDLPYSHRNNGIIVSAQRVRQALMSGPARTAIAARQLQEEIEIFPPRRPALPG
ncbi:MULTISPECIES: hypothetical protein [Streptomyces]|uniref:XRE family transcriptional regulator n=1 Tax=Streptomyces melanosporofaciens TaxID=67327 RepID=A0A1H4IE48_STRMJ|nr:hypothetical protein [Streptomyces melanosporofaciens]SEB31532.1 hypothetical protein SAMN04490356_0455 [Streptomyces melanosporofaciens]